MKKDLYNMFKWTLSTAFDKHPTTKISLRELEKILDDVWYDMDRDGDIKEGCNGGPF